MPSSRAYATAAESSGLRPISELESPGVTLSRDCDRPVPCGIGRTPNGRRRGPPPPPCSGHIQTLVTITEVYVGAETAVGLEEVARKAKLRPLDGGRLVLRPFPTLAVPRLAERVQDVVVAPWPRVYADLRPLGVRGEEAAQHLAEVHHVD